MTCDHQCDHAQCIKEWDCRKTFDEDSSHRLDGIKRKYTHIHVYCILKEHQYIYKQIGIGVSILLPLQLL